MHIVYSLFLFISASVLVYWIFLYGCIFFSFDATILMNKDVYINSENREQLTRDLQFHQQDIHAGLLFDYLISTREQDMRRPNFITVETVDS